MIGIARLHDMRLLLFLQWRRGEEGRCVFGGEGGLGSKPIRPRCAHIIQPASVFTHTTHDSPSVWDPLSLTPTLVYFFLHLSFCSSVCLSFSLSLSLTLSISHTHTLTQTHSGTNTHTHSSRKEFVSECVSLCVYVHAIE